MAAVTDPAMADAGGALQAPRAYPDLLQTMHSDAFAFSNREERALGLYDHLRELELQIGLLEAHTDADAPDVSGLSDHALQEQLTIAEREAMEARAEYELRNRITHNALIVDPVLRAIHDSERTEYAEQRIAPLIAENDTVSMLHGSQAAKLATAKGALKTTEQGNIAANERNRELSRTLLALAGEMKARSTKDIEDAGLRAKVHAVEKGVKETRRRVRNLKGLLSGMIVGSGINWAEDAELRELVMDDEDDG